jgi:hypothetical protein
MRCVSERISLNDLPDFFGPELLGKALGINANRAYELAHRTDFPKLRVGKKYVIAKAGLLRWLEQNAAI